MAVPDLLEENETAPENIGAILRNAREAAGFSVADVAERMRLSRHHIENLEAERFDLFPVSVFLRGYLISYARLLGIDAEPLLEAYDRRGFGPPQLHSQQTAPAASRGSEFTVTVTTLIVIAVLIVLSALWWREQWTDDAELPGAAVEQPEYEGVLLGGGAGPGEPAETPEPAGETAPAELPDPVATAEAPGVEPPPVPFAAEPDESEATPGTVEPAATAVAEAPQGPAPAREVEREEPAATPTDGPDTDSEAAAGTPDRRPEPVPPRAETVATAPGAAGGSASLVIRAREDSWLMIRDAEQRLIYRDLASAGTILELTAVPPIRVVAGYAEGIEVEYNGEPFDLSPYVEQDTGTARFRLGS